MSNKVKVGIIGLGGISRLMHLPNVKQSVLTELAAVCDIAPGKAESTAREYDVPEWYDDPYKMLQQAHLDAVVIATPNHTHHDLSVAALGADFHVLSEKPIALNSAEAAHILEVASRKKRIFMADFQERFWPESMILKRFIEAGDLGTIYYGEAVWMRRRGMPPSPTYYQKELTGGGPLIDLGVHVVDLLRWWMGDPEPVTVSAATFNRLARRPDLHPPAHDGFNPAHYTVEDMAAGHVRFANGALLTVKVSWMSEIEKSPPHVILGDRGGAEFAPREKFVIYSQKHGALVNLAPVIPTDGPGRHLRLLEHFASCVMGRAEPIITHEEMLMGMRIVEAMYRSAEEGHEVSLD
jgi:predicted dehydrogenase